jgi:hypothetical protein
MARNYIGPETNPNSGATQPKSSGASVAVDIVKPRVNYINEVALGAGVGNLAQATNFFDAQVNSGLKFLSDSQKMGSRERSESANRERLIEQTQKLQAVQQENDILTEFQRNVFDQMSAYSQSHSYDEGLYEATLEITDDLSRKALGTPVLMGEQDARLQKLLGQYSSDFASRAFMIEQAGREANAIDVFKKAQSEAVVNVSNGVAPDMAVSALQPMVEEYGRAFPHRKGLFEAGVIDVKQYSIDIQAKSNPDLAEANLKSRFYSDLTIPGREKVENTILAARRRKAAEARKIRSAAFQKITSEKKNAK